MNNRTLLTLFVCIFAVPLKAELVNIATAIPSIARDIRYATKNNCTGTSLYENDYCYVQETTAEKLKNVQEELLSFGLSLKIWDAFHPADIGHTLAHSNVSRAVINPTRETTHNNGTGIDVTLITDDGKALEMPSDFDDFDADISTDVMSDEVFQNFLVLSFIMGKHGFIQSETAWWHFDDEEWEQFPIIERTFQELEKAS